MELKITRLKSNRTCTISTLHVIDDDIPHAICWLQEGVIPANRTNYGGHLLPPGTYSGHIETVNMHYGGETVQVDWPVLDRVQWFPRAGFFTSSDIGARKGIMLIGTKVENEQWGVVQSAEAMLRLSRVCYAHRAAGDKEFTLYIIQDEDLIEWSDMNFHDYAVAKAEREQIERVRKAQSEFVKARDAFDYQYKKSE